VVVGGGLARLFPPDHPTVGLELRSAQTFKSGVLNLSYRPAIAPGDQHPAAVDTRQVQT